jgi:hypothetical protein
VVATATVPPNSTTNPQQAFSSYHPAGTNFLSGDGSVKLVPETIDQMLYLALCTRVGGEVVAGNP